MRYTPPKNQAKRDAKLRKVKKPPKDPLQCLRLQITFRSQ